MSQIIRYLQKITVKLDYLLTEITVHYLSTQIYIYGVIQSKIGAVLQHLHKTQIKFIKLVLPKIFYLKWSHARIIHDLNMQETNYWKKEKKPICIV